MDRKSQVRLSNLHLRVFFRKCYCIFLSDKTVSAVDLGHLTVVVTARLALLVPNTVL